jgi:hypothetical protein
MARNDMLCCPYCGGPLKRSARACPHCGSDERTGWSDKTYLDGIDLENDFEYGETLRTEFGVGGKRKNPFSLLYVTAGAVLLLLFLLLVLRGVFRC